MSVYIYVNYDCVSEYKLTRLPRHLTLPPRAEKEYTNINIESTYNLRTIVFPRNKFIRESYKVLIRTNMGFTLKVAFTWFCLANLVVYVRGDQETSSFDVLRGEHDSFQNLECQNQTNCTDEQCEKYGADCEDDKCERCQCKYGRNTFLANTDDTGNCTADEMVVPESGMELKNSCHAYTGYVHAVVSIFNINTAIYLKYIGVR